MHTAQRIRDVLVDNGAGGYVASFDALLADKDAQIKALADALVVAKKSLLAHGVIGDEWADIDAALRAVGRF